MSEIDSDEEFDLSEEEALQISRELFQRSPELTTTVRTWLRKHKVASVMCTNTGKTTEHTHVINEYEMIKWKEKFNQSISEIQKFGHVYIHRTDDEFSIVMFRRNYFDVEVCKNCKLYDRTASILGDFCTLCEDFDI
jgi:hypothetical protein